MENIHKHFLSLYKYYRNIVVHYLIHIGMIGFRFAFFLSSQPFFQSIYKCLFVKRPRDSNDILIEPDVTQQWMCSSNMNPITPSAKKSVFHFKKSSTPSSKHSFELKEDYHFPLFPTKKMKNLMKTRICLLIRFVWL